MMKLSRGALAAIAAVIAVPATVAIAHNYERGGWHRMDPETRTRLQEGKLAGAKAALKLTGEQEKLWSAVETEIRAAFAARAERKAEREKMREERSKARDEGNDPVQGPGKGDMSERIDKMSQRMSERAERMKAFAAAFKPFYASLSDEQKQVLRPVMRDLMPVGRGHGKKRWAHGGGRHGWGDDHGWHHKGKWREGRSDRDDDRGGGGRGEERGPPVEQMMPDLEGEGPAAPGDQL